MVTVYAPASIGNVSVGFDVLGAAVSPVDGSLLGDCVTVEAAAEFSLKSTGRFVAKLPTNPHEADFYFADIAELNVSGSPGKPDADAGYQIYQN